LRASRQPRRGDPHERVEYDVAPPHVRALKRVSEARLRHLTGAGGGVGLAHRCDPRPPRAPASTANPRRSRIARSCARFFVHGAPSRPLTLVPSWDLPWRSSSTRNLLLLSAPRWNPRHRRSSDLRTSRQCLPDSAGGTRDDDDLASEITQFGCFSRWQCQCSSARQVAGEILHDAPAAQYESDSGLESGLAYGAYAAGQAEFSNLANHRIREPTGRADGERGALDR